MIRWLRRLFRPEPPPTGRTRGRSAPAPEVASWLSLERLQVGGLFVLFGTLVFVVCFLGLSPAGPQISLNQVPRIRITAEDAFSYVSQIKTERLRSERRAMVAPVYRIDLESFRGFEQALTRLFEGFDVYASGTGEVGGAPAPSLRFTAEEVRRVLQDHPAADSLGFSTPDLLVLLNDIEVPRRREAMEEGLRLLESILREGIYRPEEHPMLGGSEGRFTRSVILREGATAPFLQTVEIQPEEDARRRLRVNLAPLNLDRAVEVALFRVLASGVRPNLHFDRRATELRTEAEANEVQDVRIEVAQGDTIIEPGFKVTPEAFEQFSAYREQRRAQASRITANPMLREHAWMTALIFIAVAIFLKITLGPLGSLRRLLLLAGFVLVLNLAVARLILELVDSEISRTLPLLPALASWMIPVAFAPLSIALLTRPAVGLACGALLSLFCAMMLGNSVPFLVASLLAALVAVRATQGAQYRARIVRASLFAGLTLALMAAFLGYREAVEVDVVLLQILTAGIAGVVTGIVVIGLLPLFEWAFKYTTNITLLELTDFNHPLLRQMQMTAPGSYHHSTLVANLSENAAAAIGANALLCRACALFHDIGKMVKPEYFAENQRDGINPHLEKNPSMSALIIKAHVKEGISLARQQKLPRVVLDVIREHHGTTLIQYFYYKAQQQHASNSPYPNAPGVDLTPVNESTYRYEGPKPQTRESAIISLADSLEAASRSLRKATPQSVEELVASIFLSRIEDDQLVECPLTLRELQAIRRSFVFTLLNMLHNRVEYPGSAKLSPKSSREPFNPPKEEAPAENSPPTDSPA